MIHHHNARTTPWHAPRPGARRHGKRKHSHQQSRSGSQTYKATAFQLSRAVTRFNGFFFLRLPFGHHGPVSELSLSNLCKLCCTGSFNWGEAHFAGEKVKQTRRTIKKKSHKNIQPNNKKQQPGRSPPRQPGTPRPGSQLHEPEKEQQNTRDFTTGQIKVRLNVHQSPRQRTYIR